MERSVAPNDGAANAKPLVRIDSVDGEQAEGLVTGTDGLVMLGGATREREAAVAEAIVGRPGTVEAAVDLVRRARDGDATAFDALARVRIDRSFRLALAILRSEMDASDAIQEAYLAAWRRLPTLRDPTRFDAWLDRIVINACRMALRHRRVVHVHEVEPDAPVERLETRDPAWSPDPEGSAVGADTVARAFEHLGADQRSILVLHHVEDRSIDDIAAILAIPAGTVKWRLHLARTALQRALEEESG